jgi:hypothetical protein
MLFGPNTVKKNEKRPLFTEDSVAETQKKNKKER